MGISLYMKTIIIFITAMLMMVIIAVSQLSRKKSLKTITLTQLKMMLGTGLLLVALVFLNSYQYIMAYVLGYIYKGSPLVIASDLTMPQPVFFNDLFVILSVIVVGLIINISLAHYTKLNYIFIAPFETLLMGYVIVLFMKFSMVSISTIVMVGGLILGLIMSMGPYMISRLCGGDLYRKSTLGFFNFTGFYLSVFIGKLFGKCDVKCQEVMGRKHSIILKNPIKFTIFGMILLTIGLNILANLQGYDTNMRLIILDQFSVEGDMIHLINLIGFIMSMGCLFGFYRLYMGVYPEFIVGIRQVFPHGKVATDFIYQLQECTPHIFIGFWLSLVGSFVCLWYLNFYNFSHVYYPNIIVVGILGIIAAKMGDIANGVKGACCSSFVNGILVTLIPTLTYFISKFGALEIQFNYLDYYFIAQLLDIFFIF